MLPAEIRYPGAGFDALVDVIHYLPALGLALLVLFGALARMRCEEHLLLQRYPEYSAYAATTKRMLPFVF